ncbi:MAG: N-acyl homoserine lactonase family protein [Acidobacteriia bacterium]|nr:N-acyl homoserine lactonase family protein [Terriglobia bacterium]
MPQITRLALVMVVLMGTAALGQAPARPVYEVYAIRYATLPDFPVSALVKDADPSRKVDLAMAVWLVKGNGHTILVDAGFYHERFFKDWTLKDFMKSSEAVMQAGVRPEEITDVIITHMHWDHADGMDLFPRARIWIQKDELSYYAGEAWQKADTHGGIDPEDVQTLVRFNTEGRVGLVNGDNQEIIPGVVCHIGGKHTYQSQYVSVNAKDGTVVLASDNMYLYENLEKHRPIGTTLDSDSNLRAQDHMKQIAASEKFIVPGHDIKVFEKFPAIAARVVKID